MPANELHEKYAPIMRFSRGERFFPTAVDDFLTYCALYVRGEEEPITPRGQVTPSDLSQHRGSRDVFLRSVAAGPLGGVAVASQWGLGAVRLLYEWSQNPAVLSIQAKAS